MKVSFLLLSFSGVFAEAASGGDGLLERVATQVPALAVLGFIVIKFLQHLKDDRTSRDSEASRFSSTITTIGDSCHEFQREIQEDFKATMRDNSAAMRENAKALTESVTAAREVRDVIAEVKERLQ
jgi:hypothetical protein